MRKVLDLLRELQVLFDQSLQNHLLMQLGIFNRNTSLVCYCRKHFQVFCLETTFVLNGIDLDCAQWFLI